MTSEKYTYFITIKQDLEKIYFVRILAILHLDIYNNWYKNKNMYSLFLDIKDACDNVLWDILIPKLINLRLPFPFIKFINHLSCLEQHFRYNDIVRHV